MTWSRHTQSHTQAKPIFISTSHISCTISIRCLAPFDDMPVTELWIVLLSLYISRSERNSRSEPFDTCFHSVVSHMRFNIGTNVWSEKLKTIFWRRKCRLYFNKNERTPTHILLIMCTRSAAFRKYFFVLFFVPVLFVRKTARMNCAKNIIMERNRYRITERDKDSEKKRRSEKEVVRRARA